MIEDIENIMSKLAGNSNIIIVNPQTLEELRRFEVSLDIVPAPTVYQLFDQRKKYGFSKGDRRLSKSQHPRLGSIREHGTWPCHKSSKESWYTRYQDGNEARFFQ